jgi:hypothetical protein
MVAVPDDLYKPLLDEFRRGWHKEKVLGMIEAKKASAINQNYHRGVDGIGRLRARIPASSFHFWGQKLGYDCWKSNAFIKEFLRDNPGLETKGGATKLQVGYGKSTSDGSKIGILDQFGRSISCAQ